jgi:formate dehydrogenase subunit delta
MKTDKLVTMANQIGTFFESYPDRDEAMREIASHLQRFWAPRMRAELMRHLEHEREQKGERKGEQKQGKEHGQEQGLSELVLAALLSHRAWIAPAAS